MFRIGERTIEFAIVLLVILCGQWTNAQQDAHSGNIRGTVVDTTGSAIANATVRVSNMAGKPVAATATSGEGSFLISGLAPATYALEVEIKNFETARQEVTVAALGASEAVLRITLSVATLQQTVGVTASGTYATPGAVGAVKIEMPIMETPISVVVVPKAVLADQQVVALDQAIQNVSGVIPNNDSCGTNDSFSIRGFDAQEMTYEDGLRLDQYSNAGFPIDMANVERVEVLKVRRPRCMARPNPGAPSISSPRNRWALLTTWSSNSLAPTAFTGPTWMPLGGERAITSVEQ